MLLPNACQSISKGNAGAQEGGTYGVLGDVDILLFAELNEIRLQQPWVALNLVGCWGDASTVNECLEVILGVV